ncbi:RNase P modulator RnpM [Tuberibacillus sp. Marseille-P3662]|uniref:RNase P modulator RnpM n=1 Tax=Tuberibacillus sp. Marseille-P3662 TaxID=1965358 RepID=UPI000A1CD3B4|nr:YlxR family protein [Tuberibacillus sp. Marseille-P3662]
MKKKKTPLRKCIACQTQEDKKHLFRIVRSPEGEVLLDPTGKKNGRGAYLSKDRICIEKARKNQLLSKQLKTDVNPDIYDEMLTLLEHPS